MIWMIGNGNRIPYAILNVNFQSFSRIFSGVFPDLKLIRMTHLGEIQALYNNS